MYWVSVNDCLRRHRRTLTIKRIWMHQHLTDICKIWLWFQMCGIEHILYGAFSVWKVGCLLDIWIVSGVSLNSLWPSDAIWHHRSGSTLAQVMVCCLTAPSHYLNQCWLTISEVLCHSCEGNLNFIGEAQDIYPWYEFAVRKLLI